MTSTESLDRAARSRRGFIQALPALAATSIAAPSLANTFPVKPLKFVVPFPAGGPTDLVARPVAQLLGDLLGQPVVVDNRGGAGGSIGADAVAKAAADGYTLLVGTVGTQAINPSLYRKLSYDPFRDLKPIGLLAMSPLAVVAHPGAAFQSLGALIAAARKSPGQINFGSAGNGTPGHLTGYLFSKAADVQLAHVAYRGSAPAITDLLAGQIPLMFDPIQSVLEHLKAQKLRALAISGKARSPVLPDVPTLAELGVNLEATAWWALYAPANTPPAIVQTLARTLREAMSKSEFVQKMTRAGVQVPAMSQEAFAAFQKSEAEKWGRAVRETGVIVE